MNSLLENNLSLVIFGILVIICIVIIIQIITNKQTKKHLKTYIDTIEKLNQYDDVGEAFASIYQKLDKTNSFCEATQKRCQETENKLQKSIQKIGFVKYSTHDIGKNELSFSIAFLDNNDDGIILNQVHTRNTSNIYAKQIEGGKSLVRLSEEESKALNTAINDKQYVKRKKI